MTEKEMTERRFQYKYDPKFRQATDEAITKFDKVVLQKSSDIARELILFGECTLIKSYDEIGILDPMPGEHSY